MEAVMYFLFFPVGESSVSRYKNRTLRPKFLCRYPTALHLLVTLGKFVEINL